MGFDLVNTHPSRENPLGIEFPGMTFTEDMNSPNWVGYLVTKRKEETSPLLVYDYAVGGHTVSGIENQVSRRFLPHVGIKPNWAPWNAKDTLFSMRFAITEDPFTHEMFRSHLGWHK